MWGNDNDHEVIEISSGSSENANVIVNEGVVDVGRQAGPRRVHCPMTVCRRPTRLRHLVQMFSFENVISKSQSKVGQALPLPRKFVEKFIRKSWRDLILQVRGGRTFSCKLLWSPRSEKDCHLGQYWYNFVSEIELKT
ncbi:DNA-binding barrel domain superfamily [Sesbania bispinosa]|nr:DNA-binding barrel domain superfamily [Sesbania bispinosa]